MLTAYKLGPDNGKRLPGHIFNPEGGQFSPQGIRIMSKLRTGPEKLTEEWYPVFVHFRDISNQKTVENVMTMELCNGYHLCMKSNNIEKIFGKGVHIKSITIEMTGDEVTRDIEKWIPWLPKRKNVPGNFGSSQPPYIDPTNTYLNGEEFSKGIYW